MPSPPVENKSHLSISSKLCVFFIWLQWAEKERFGLATMVGLYPRGLQVLCPGLALKKETRVSNRDITGVMDGGTYYPSESRSWSDTPQCAVDGGQNVPAGFTLVGGNRKAISYGGTDFSLAHRLPGKSAE